MTSGIQARRDCLAASRAVSRHLASERSPRAPCHTGMQRAAAHGTIRSTPTSVISSTASSPRSPLGMAWTTVIAGSGRGTSRRACTVSPRPPSAGPATTHSATSPGAVGHVGALARAQPAHGGRVPALGAGQDHHVGCQRLAVGQEDGRLH